MVPGAAASGGVVWGVVMLRYTCLVISTWLLARILAVLWDIIRVGKPKKVGSKPETKGKAASDLSKSDTPKLTAGSTVKRVEPGQRDEQTWSALGAERFNVRCGPNYKKNGFKAPSGPALAELVAIDTFFTKRKVYNFLQYNHVALPEPTPGWSEPYAEFLVINQMLPRSFSSSIFTSEDTDGETLNLVFYVRVPPGLAAGWRGDDEPTGAEQLFKRFLLRADQDPAIAHCFKEIGILLNLDELSSMLPKAVHNIFARFNGKPVLTRPEHYFHRDPQHRYFAVDLDGHRYKIITRSGIAKVIPHLKKFSLAFGMVVEARKEPEMPEVMAFSCQVNHLCKAMNFPPEDPPTWIHG